MLIYHPAFDYHHCIFRVLCLLEHLPKDTYHIERIRILDFYFLFPHSLKTVTFPKAARRYRKAVIGSSNTYEDIRDPYRVFSQLEAYQLTALRYLASRGLIDASALNDGKVKRNTAPLSTPILEQLSKTIERQKILIECLCGPFKDVDLYGNSGLKARTQLFQYRYDPS
jgi:hypothetical protein